jgi:hypothetical protein
MSYTKETIAAINKVLPPFVQLTEQSPPADLWAALFRLYGEQVQGPKGHATWKDAALAELLLRTRGVALPGPSLSMHPADKREMDRAFNEATDHSAQTLDMVAPGAGVPTLEPSAGAGSEPNSGTLVPAAGVGEVPRG